MISRVHHLDDRTRYDTKLEPHHHLVCVKCKTIQDFYWPTLDGVEVPEETKEWGRIQDRYVELRGVCGECLKGEKKGGGD